MQFGLALPSGRPELDLAALCSEEERAVVRALEWGREGARSIDELAGHTDMPGRRLQELVDHLIIDHWIPIGTSMRRPFGNYLIEDQDDRDRTTELLERRALHTLKRVSALRKEGIRRALERLQTRLDLEDAEC